MSTAKIIHLPSPLRGTPTAVNGKVAPPRRRKNAESRTREHLTPDEVEQLLAAARRGGRYGQRDETLALLAYRHGFRVSELVALRWEQIDFTAGLLSRQSRPHPDAALVENPVIVHTSFAIEFSTLYLTDRFTGEPPTEEPLRQWVPLVEFEFDTPLSSGYGRATAATMNPGIAYTGETFQVSAEAIVPLSHFGGSSGFRVGVALFLDDLMPSLFGKPVFH